MEKYTILIYIFVFFISRNYLFSLYNYKIELLYYEYVASLEYLFRQIITSILFIFHCVKYSIIHTREFNVIE